MKKIESFRETDKKSSSILRTLVVAAIFLVIFLILIVTGQFIFLFQVFGWIQHQVRIYTGADMLIANGISAVLMAIIFALPIWGFLRSFLPLPQKHRKIYRLSTFICFALFFFALYFSSQNVFFNPDNGEPLKYYSVASNGQYKFYSSGGYDHLTGDALKKVTKEIVLKYLSQSSDEFSMEANLSSYSGTINNLTTKTICFFIAPNLNSNNLSMVKLIPPQTKMAISLTEGTHSFALLNADGENIVLYPLKNEKVNTVNSSVSSSGVANWVGSGMDYGKEWKNYDWRGKHLELYDPMTITNANANFNGHKYEIKCLYYLNVIPKNNWNIYIEDSYIKF